MKQWSMQGAIEDTTCVDHFSEKSLFVVLSTLSVNRYPVYSGGQDSRKIFIAIQVFFSWFWIKRRKSYVHAHHLVIIFIMCEVTKYGPRVNSVL